MNDSLGVHPGVAILVAVAGLGLAAILAAVFYGLIAYLTVSYFAAG